MRAGQFLPAVAQQSAQCGIRFQDPAIELTYFNANRGPFKEREEAQIAIMIGGGRKLSDNVHFDVFSTIHFRTSSRVPESKW